MRTRDENKELKIRQKALAMVAKFGYDAFSMQRLAKEAGVSPATIYIYYKDKEDLILSLYQEESRKMADETLKGFDSLMPFSEGLRIQWINRAKYCMKYPEQMLFLEQIKLSSLHAKAWPMMGDDFRSRMKEFVTNAIKNKELVKVQVEVYWSVAFAPLYNLVRFHMAGKNMGGDAFVLTDTVMMNTLELVLKALRP